MQRNELYLLDIVEASDAIASFIHGIDEVRFVSNDMIRSAVLQKLTIIGEAAAQISTDLRSRHPDIPWRNVVAFRNLVVHAYFRVDWSIVWTTATQDVPDLRNRISKIIQIESSQGTP